MMKHLVSVKGMTLDVLTDFLYRTTDMKYGINNSKKYLDKILGLVFFEPSTRTLCSFQAAMQKLGGSVIIVNDIYSSTKKGESLEDTIKTMCCYCDAIVLRHPTVGSSAQAVSVSTKPIINAGDGSGEHPTQALLDVFTIHERLQKMSRYIDSGITVVFVGDLKNSRTVHSLIELLCLYTNITFVYVCPSGLEMPDDVVKRVGAKQVFGLSLKEAVSMADVLYVTRIQKERFENISQYESLIGSYVVDSEIMKLAKTNMMVMHPLPRNEELSVDIDDDARCAYFDQMTNGVFMRMTILDTMLSM